MLTPQQIADCYEQYNYNVKRTARFLGVSEEVVVRSLTSLQIWVNDTARRVHALLEHGKSKQEICRSLRLSPDALRRYLPYSKGSYLQREQSGKAAYLAAWRAAHKPNITHNIRRAIAQNNGMTQELLAKLMDVDRDTVRRWLNSSRLPSVATLNRLGELLHCDAAYLANTSPSFLVEVDDAPTVLCQLVRVAAAIPGNSLMAVIVDHPDNGWLRCAASPFTFRA